jgi:hypothetical protein
VAGALQPSIRIAEIERSRRKRPQDLGAYDFTIRAMPHVWALEKDESVKALELLEKALKIDPKYPLALALAGWCHAQRSVYNWADDIAESQAMARPLACCLSGPSLLTPTVHGLGVDSDGSIIIRINPQMRSRSLSARCVSARSTR